MEGPDGGGGVIKRIGGEGVAKVNLQVGHEIAAALIAEAADVNPADAFALQHSRTKALSQHAQICLHLVEPGEGLLARRWILLRELGSLVANLRTQGPDFAFSLCAVRRFTRPL